MSPDVLPVRRPRGVPSVLQMQLWQLAVVVLYVAIAIVDIQNYGRKEPVLVLLAALGYGTFGFVCWLCWHAIRRLQPRLGTVGVTAVYVGTMGGLFLTAVVAYLAIEYVYLGGTLL